MVDEAKQVFKKTDMIMKVKEPMPSEYKMIKKEQIVFTYFHFAASRDLTQAIIDQHCVCIAYETVETEKRTLLLLAPMSEVTGKMADMSLPIF